jgi:hypothetical protein
MDRVRKLNISENWKEVPWKTENELADYVIRTDINRLLGVGLQWLKIIFYDNVSTFLALLHIKSYIAVIWRVCV